MLEQNEQTRAWSFDGSKSIGVLVIHGFTSTPASMRPVADAIAERGFQVELPRLPGHGTEWQDLERVKYEEWEKCVLTAYDILKKRSQEIFVLGLSMGGVLAARVAELKKVHGLVLINHALKLSSPLLPLVPLLKYVMRTNPAIAGDIFKEGSKEIAYDTLPVRAVHEMLKLMKRTRRELSAITAPLLIFKSRHDHVVPIKNVDYTLKKVSSEDKKVVWLEKSYHVATQDVEAPLIIEETLRFIEKYQSIL